MNKKIANEYARIVLDMTGIAENINILNDIAEEEMVDKCGALDEMSGICYTQINLKEKLKSTYMNLDENKKLNFEKLMRDDDFLLNVTREYNGTFLFEFLVNLPIDKKFLNGKDFIHLNVKFSCKSGYDKPFDVFGDIDENQIDKAEKYFTKFCQILD